MKPVISFFVLMAIAVSAIAKPNINKHISETGPNPVYFNGNVAEAKIYFKAADGKELPIYTKYTFINNTDYTMEVWNHQDRVSYTILETNKEGTQQNRIVEGEHGDRRNRINVLENGNIIKEMYQDPQKDELRTLKTYSYDEQGRLTGIEYLDDANDSMKEKLSYKGNTITRELVSQKGDLTLTRTDTYVLDDHNNPVKITSTDGWGQQEPKVFTFKYTYDNKGNYTQVAMYREGKLMNTQYREITY